MPVHPSNYLSGCFPVHERTDTRENHSDQIWWNLVQECISGMSPNSDFFEIWCVSVVFPDKSPKTFFGLFEPKMTIFQKRLRWFWYIFYVYSVNNISDITGKIVEGPTPLSEKQFFFSGCRMHVRIQYKNSTTIKIIEGI